MVRNRTARIRLVTGVAVAAAVIGLAWWSVRSATDSPDRLEVSSADDDTALRPATEPARTQLSSGAIALPIYRSRSAGLPPADTPFKDSHAALRVAAAHGNATAACRLAFAAIECWGYPVNAGKHASPSASETRSTVQEPSRWDEEMTARSARRVGEAPPALREFVRSRVEELEVARATYGAEAALQARRCAGAPLISSGEAAHLLRQAALAGQPDALVAYAHGQWIETIIGINAARVVNQPASSLELLRDPAFDRWRRDAAAFHRAALEAGIPQALELEAMPNGFSNLDQLVQRDPVDQAAALRALAGVVGTGAPPSTASLGLSEAQAALADRRSERWMQAASRRAGLGITSSRETHTEREDSRRLRCE